MKDGQQSRLKASDQPENFIQKIEPNLFIYLNNKALHFLRLNGEQWEWLSEITMPRQQMMTLQWMEATRTLWLSTYEGQVKTLRFDAAYALLEKKILNIKNEGKEVGLIEIVRDEEQLHFISSIGELELSADGDSLKLASSSNREPKQLRHLLKTDMGWCRVYQAKRGDNKYMPWAEFENEQKTYLLPAIPSYAPQWIYAASSDEEEHRIYARKGIFRIRKHTSTPPESKTAFSELSIRNEPIPDARIPENLPHNQNQIRFSLQSPSYLLGHRNQLATRLLPLEEEWTIARQDGAREFTALPPGDYTLEVRTDHPLQDTQQTILAQWTIRPPWYFSLYAWITYAVTAYVSFRLWLYRRDRLAAEREATLEQEVQMRMDHERRLLRQLTLANAQKRNFLHTLSHEFRSPLGALRLIAQTLRNRGESQPEKTNMLLSEFEGNVRYLDHLLTDSLDYTRLEGGFVQLAFDVFSPHKLAENLCQMFNAKAREQSVKLELESALDAEAQFRSDPTAIERILVNFLSNALKYSPDGGRITVKIEANTKGDLVELRFSVRDEGPGIAESDHRHIFAEFAQGRHEARSGTGLGLAIANRYALALDGKLGLESKLGEGSCFSLQLTLYPDQTVQRQETTLQAYFQGKVALLAEDDDYFSRALVSILEELGIRSTTVKDGEEALSHLLRVDYALVFMDYDLPRKNGLDVLKQLRLKRPDYPGCVLAMTGYRAEDVQQDFQSYGAVATLHKPINPAGLHTVLLQIASQKS